MASVPAGSPDELPIDVELIKVLASDTRRDVLRLLGERRRTLTELADALGLKKATILEHLQKLVAADLIKRLDEDERLWIYYELTPRGKRLVRPERTRFFLILGGTAAAALILGAIVAAAMLSGTLPTRAVEDGNEASVPMGGSADTFEEMDPASRIDAPSVLWRGLDEEATFRVASAPDDSILRLRAADGTGTSVPVEDGVATLGAADIDALRAGEHRLYLTSSAGELDLLRPILVQEPSIAVFPLAIPQNASATLEVALAPPGVPTSPEVRVDGVVAKATGSPVLLDVLAADNAARLEVGRLFARDIVTIPQFAVELSTTGTELTLRASEAGAPLAGAQIALDGLVVGSTNESGGLVAPLPNASAAALRIVAADGRAHERAIAIGNGTASELGPALRLEAHDARVGPAAGLRLRADVFNDNPAEQLVTVAAREQGALLASQLVRVPAHGRAEVLLEAPLLRPSVVDITAHAARTSATVTYAYGQWDGANWTQDAASSPTAGTTMGAPVAASGPPTSMRLVGQSADARDTVVLAQPTMPTSAGTTAPTAAPQVPLASPLVLVALVVLVALALRRRR